MSLGENQLYGRAGKKKKKSLMGHNFSGFNPLGCFLLLLFFVFSLQQRLGGKRRSVSIS